MSTDNRLLVFNIQKYSLHDGSGIRTVVFLKGCPLRCLWCCNPESQNTGREIIYRRSRCIGKSGCGLCTEACPAGGISYDEDGKAVIDFKICNTEPEWCMVCPARALEIEGTYMDIDEIIGRVEQDAAFYRRGRGGLTVSGGEALLQKNTILLLKKAKEHRINTAIETCGHVPCDRLLEAAEYLDTIFFDIKSLNDSRHEEYTGVSGELIRANYEALCRAYPGKRIVARTPVIPGFNDSEEELAAIKEFVLQYEGVEWERLPYHRFGVGKYEMLGRTYRLHDI